MPATMSLAPLVQRKGFWVGNGGLDVKREWPFRVRDRAPTFAYNSSFRPDSGSWSRPLRLFRRGFDLAKMPVHKLLYVRHAVELQQLHVLFDPPVQRHAHLPGTGVDLLIIDTHLIEKRIRAGGCVT